MAFSFSHGYLDVTEEDFLMSCSSKVLVYLHRAISRAFEQAGQASSTKLKHTYYTNRFTSNPAGVSYKLSLEKSTGAESSRLDDLPRRF